VNPKLREKGGNRTKDHHLGSNANGGPESRQDTALLEDVRGDGCSIGHEHLDGDEANEQDTCENQQGDNSAVRPL
jgi:hypothetical protein